MTMPHLMNCPHSYDGWCLECVKELHDSQEIDLLLSSILFAETTFDAGPGRSVEDVSIQLWGDGSGNLLVKISADAPPGHEMLLNRVFYTEYKYPFDTLEDLRKMLANMDLLKSSHPEVE